MGSQALFIAFWGCGRLLMSRRSEFTADMSKLLSMVSLSHSSYTLFSKNIDETLGVYVVLFFICLYILQARRNPGWTIFFITAILMFSLSTTILVVSIDFVEGIDQFTQQNSQSEPSLGSFVGSYNVNSIIYVINK